MKEPELNILDENDESLADGEEGEKPKVRDILNLFLIQEDKFISSFLFLLETLFREEKIAEMP